MDFTLIIKDTCTACARVEKALKVLAGGKIEILLSVINTKDLTNRENHICPALFINQGLYSYGDINEENLITHLNKQYKDGACSDAVYQST